MPKHRLALHAYVSEETHAAWHAFAADHGLSVSSVFEALGERLTAASAQESDAVGFDAQLVVEARRIDVMRRKRKGQR